VPPTAPVDPRGGRIDTLFGIPAHPLLVHVPVVFTPLSAAGALLIAVVPRWRAPFGLLVAAFAVVAAVGTQLAYDSGHELEDRIDVTRAVEKHIDLATVTRPLVFVFAAVVVVFVALSWWLDRRPRSSTPRWKQPALLAASAVMVLSAALATVWTVRAGHQGADAVWRGTGETGQDGG